MTRRRDIWKKKVIQFRHEVDPLKARGSHGFKGLSGGTVFGTMPSERLVWAVLTWRYSTTNQSADVCNIVSTDTGLLDRSEGSRYCTSVQNGIGCQSIRYFSRRFFQSMMHLLRMSIRVLNMSRHWWIPALELTPLWIPGSLYSIDIDILRKEWKTI
jgi:hypothetical protein